MNAIDPAREKVERADAIVREFQEPVIEDPTVFVKGAALGALTAIELARRAQAMSRGPAVRAFADRMHMAQGAILKELTAIAGRKRLDVPASLVYLDEQMLQGAPEEPGAQFDAWFVQQAHAEHLKSMALYEAAMNMKDAQLAAFAGRTLPVLEDGRREASTLVGTSGG
jgi:putative membrane protein